MSELKALRKSSGYMQEFVAAHIGVKQNTFSAYENGHRELPPRFIRTLAALYSVPVERIVEAAYPEHPTA